jgi:hypothetical protein
MRRRKGKYAQDPIGVAPFSEKSKSPTAKRPPATDPYNITRIYGPEKNNSQTEQVFRPSGQTLSVLRITDRIVRILTVRRHQFGVHICEIQTCRVVYRERGKTTLGGRQAF